MKKINYSCDVCGNEIEPQNRAIPLAYDKTMSCYKSFMRIKISQIRTLDNCSERDMEMDLCDECWGKIADVILNKIKV